MWRCLILPFNLWNFIAGQIKMGNRTMDFTTKYHCQNMNFEKVAVMLSKTYWSPENTYWGNKTRSTEFSIGGWSTLSVNYIYLVI